MEEEDNYVEYVPVAKRRALTAQMILQRRGNSSALEDELEKSKFAEAKPSLLVKASQLKRDQPEISQTEQIVQQEKEMIEHLSDYWKLSNGLSVCVLGIDVLTMYCSSLHCCSLDISALPG